MLLRLVWTHSAVLGHLSSDWLVRVSPLPTGHTLYAGLSLKNRLIQLILSKVWCMNNFCTCSAMVLLWDLMPLMSSKVIYPGTRLTQYYQSWRLGHEIKHNSPAEHCRPQKRVSKETTYISFPKAWRSLTISNLHRGWFPQERRPEIMFLYQRVEAHSATKRWDAHIHTNVETPQ